MTITGFIVNLQSLQNHCQVYLVYGLVYNY